MAYLRTALPCVGNDASCCGFRQAARAKSAECMACGVTNN